MLSLLTHLFLAQPTPITLTPNELTNATQTFKVKGSWISPLVVNEFLPLISDHSRPIVRVIDVAASLESNRTFGEVVVSKGAVRVNQENAAFIEYQWLGRAKNGQHVLIVKTSGGGSGVFVSLVTFTLTTATARDESGKAYSTLDLAIQRYRSLGDRVVPKLSLSGNRVSGVLECPQECPQRTLTLELD